jgi:hypothetical protein
MAPRPSELALKVSRRVTRLRDSRYALQSPGTRLALSTGCYGHVVAIRVRAVASLKIFSVSARCQSSAQ